MSTSRTLLRNNLAGVLALISRPPCRHISQTARRRSKQAADDPNFMSIVDNPPNLIRTGRRHGPGLIVLGLSSAFSSNRSPANLTSSHSNNRICTGDLASTATRLEIQTYSKIRRPPRPRSPPITPSHRPKCYQRI
jgi:hypothetical protein